MTVSSGRRSLTWRVNADLSAPVAGLRALLMQALHPLVMVGVDQHSRWRADPVGRLAATTGYVAAITYGDRDTARRAAQRVRAVHEHVRGTDTVTGLPYAATDPALLLWVHATLVDSALAATGLFGMPLPARDANRYVSEMTVAAELAGVPRGIIPSDVAALDRYMMAVRPQLGRTPAAAEVMAWLLDPPGMEEEIAGLWQDIRTAAATALPDWARDMYGCPPAARLTPGRRTEIRQALGMLDAAILGEPGVLQARQRLALRVRSTPPMTPRTRAVSAARRPRPGPCCTPVPRNCAPSAGWRHCCWPRAAARGTRATPRGCSRPRASTGNSCATTWPCRPPKTSPPRWAP